MPNPRSHSNPIKIKPLVCWNKGFLIFNKLQEILMHWGEKLLYTNYIPHIPNLSPLWKASID